MAVDPSTLEYQYRSGAGAHSGQQATTYAVNFSSGGKDYTFIPDSVINKGVSYGEDTYVMPWFLNKDNLATLGKVGQKVDLAGQSWYGDYLKDTVGASTSGFLVPSGSIPFDSKVTTFPTSQGAVLGMTEKDGNLVYAQKGDSNQIKFVDNSGTTHTTTYTPGHSILGDIFGDFGEQVAGFVNNTLGAVNSLGPLGAAAIYAVNPVAGAAVTGANTGQAIAKGAPLGDIVTGLAASYAGSQLGSAVGSELGNQAAGQIAGNTASGLLRGQDLGTAAGNAALSTGAYQAAGGLLNTFNTPSSAANYSTGANYDLTQGQNTGGLGLKADLAPTDASNPYSFNTTFGNQDSMGGGTGIQVPTQPGATLGSIGAETEASTGSPTNTAAQKLLSQLLLAGITGNKNMATTTANNNLLGGAIGGGLTLGGGLLQGSTTAAAQQAQADALRQAGQLASSQAQFRPVGTTTTFGTSNFQVDPTTGQLTSAGYSLSPEMQAYQNQIMGAGQQSLADAANLQNLGRGYIAQTPEQAAQQWMSKQQALLQPGRDVESARLANQLQQTGRTGVSVAQGGNLGAANPEMQALANARAMQDAQMAANAQQYGQQQVNFGQGLLSSAYQPFNAGLTTASNVEQLGQNPLALSSGLAQQSSAAGAKAGQLQLGANQAAAQAALGAANYNPFASALSGLGGSSLFGSALGNLAGSTGVGSAIGNWLGSLNPSFSDLTGWSNGGNGVVTLPDGSNVNLADYFNKLPATTPATTNSFDATNLTPEERKQLGLD
jgi:hypothetical protein